MRGRCLLVQGSRGCGTANRRRSLCQFARQSWRGSDNLKELFALLDSCVCGGPGNAIMLRNCLSDQPQG